MAKQANPHFRKCIKAEDILVSLLIAAAVVLMMYPAFDNLQGKIRRINAGDSTCVHTF